jgi:succinate dehydrogenase/fumarate reductase cytochrome b subunit
MNSWVWLCIPVITAFGKWRYEDQKFKASLGCQYLVSKKNVKMKICTILLKLIFLLVLYFHFVNSVWTLKLVV